MASLNALRVEAEAWLEEARTRPGEGGAGRGEPRARGRRAPRGGLPGDRAGGGRAARLEPRAGARAAPAAASWCASSRTPRWRRRRGRAAPRWRSPAGGARRRAGWSRRWPRRRPRSRLTEERPARLQREAAVEPRLGGAPVEGAAGAGRAGRRCERARGRRACPRCSMRGGTRPGRRSTSTASCARPRTRTATCSAGRWGRWRRASCRCLAATPRSPTSSGRGRCRATPGRWRRRTRRCGRGRRGCRHGGARAGTSGSGPCPRPPHRPSRWTSRSGIELLLPATDAEAAEAAPPLLLDRAARCTSRRWSRRPRWSTAGWETARWWRRRAGWCAGCSGASDGCGRRSASARATAREVARMEALVALGTLRAEAALQPHLRTMATSGPDAAAAGRGGRRALGLALHVRVGRGQALGDGGGPGPDAAAAPWGGAGELPVDRGRPPLRRGRVPEPDAPRGGWWPSGAGARPRRRSRWRRRSARAPLEGSPRSWSGARS